MQETPVPFLGWEDPLEKEMATQLRYACLGNPTDRGAWQATVYGVAKSRTRLSMHTHNTLGRDFPGGPGDETVHPMHRARVQSQVRELDPVWHN